MTIKASDYQSRPVLDDYVRNELGDNIDANRQAGHTIEGTTEELLQLSLSPTTRVYGVRVVLQDKQV